MAGRHLPPSSESPGGAVGSSHPAPVVHYRESADIRSQPYEVRQGRRDTTRLEWDGEGGRDQCTRADLCCCVSCALSGCARACAALLVGWQGERSIAALLHMDDLVPRILAFLSPVELMFVSSVSTHWRTGSVDARRRLIPRLHLGQFWSRIGVLPTQHFVNIAKQFDNVTEVNFAYCSFMAGEQLRAILGALPSAARITKLNLFYCYQLQDADIEQLLTSATLPVLRELNLGRCNKLTERSVRLLSEQCPTLTYLNLAHNPSLGADTLMIFDDTKYFPKLQLLNLMHCAKLRMDEVEEMLKSPSTAQRNLALAKQGLQPLRIIGPQELFQIDKSGKKMRKDIDADT